MNITMTLSEDAWVWILDKLHDDQTDYLTYGEPRRDYGEEWREVGMARAGYFREIAKATPYQGDADRWNTLADEFEESVKHPDDYQVCHGEKGGVWGNENRVGDVVMCDYCTVEYQKWKETASANS